MEQVHYPDEAKNHGTLDLRNDIGSIMLQGDEFLNTVKAQVSSIKNEFSTLKLSLSGLFEKIRGGMKTKRRKNRSEIAAENNKRRVPGGGITDGDPVSDAKKVQGDTSRVPKK